MPPTPSRPVHPPPPGGTPDARSQAMAKSLGAILDRVSGARDALPLMAALERSLLRLGIGAVESASTTSLTRIASQLATLPVADDDAPMQDLQSRLLAVIGARAHANGSPQGFLSSFLTERKLAVSESSLSDFMRATEDPKRRTDGE